MLRFRYPVGHALTAECADQQQGLPVQAAHGSRCERSMRLQPFWQGWQRTLVPKDCTLTASDFEDHAEDYRRDAETIREALLREERPLLLGPKTETIDRSCVLKGPEHDEVTPGYATEPCRRAFGPLPHSNAI